MIFARVLQVFCKERRRIGQLQARYMIQTQPHQRREATPDGRETS